MVPGWIMFKTMEVLSGDPQSPALEDRVRRLRQPMLMVSAGTAEEYEFGVLYDRVGNANVEHWNLPDATHTAAIRQEAKPYEARVDGASSSASCAERRGAGTRPAPRSV